MFLTALCALSATTSAAAAGVAAMNGLRLTALTGRMEFASAADKMLRRFGSRMASAPRDYPAMLSALNLQLPRKKTK